MQIFHLQMPISYFNIVYLYCYLCKKELPNRNDRIFPMNCMLRNSKTKEMKIHTMILYWFRKRRFSKGNSKLETKQLQRGFCNSENFKKMFTLTRKPFSCTFRYMHNKAKLHVSSVQRFIHTNVRRTLNRQVRCSGPRHQHRYVEFQRLNVTCQK